MKSYEFLIYLSLIEISVPGKETLPDVIPSAFI